MVGGTDISRENRGTGKKYDKTIMKKVVYQDNGE
jgi:hypothetical protein